jgi:hypothetical protein
MLLQSVVREVNSVFEFDKLLEDATVKAMSTGEVAKDGCLVVLECG